MLHVTYLIHLANNSTGINEGGIESNVVLRQIFLYQDKYFYTGVNNFRLEYITLYWDNYFCITHAGHSRNYLT